MGNTFKTTTNLWIIDGTGVLDTTPKVIMHVIYFPSVAGDDLVITDASDNEAIVLKAGASDTSPVHISFIPYGRRLPSVKIGTFDGGAAYIYYQDVRSTHI